MATVYRADDTTLRREVAIKVLHPHLLKHHPDQKARFLREARAAAGLDHPGIARIFDVDEDEDETPFIVMELLRGRSLKQVLDTHGPPVAEVVALIGAALAEALAVAHDAGVIHRDVKPANVMVTGGGRLVLCDFGVARVIDDDALATVSGMLLGTPVFMSPEQALGRKVDARTDIYSLGATLYAAATGGPPFAGGTAAVVQQVIRGQLIPPARRLPTVGSELSSAIERAMARDPEARPASARELGAALTEIASSSGFSDARAELAAYFEEPEAFSKQAGVRIIAATVTRARAAAAQGKVARSLSLAERVLAFDAGNPDANSLIARVGIAARRRRQATALAITAVGVAGAGLALAALWPGERKVVGPGLPDAGFITVDAPYRWDAQEALPLKGPPDAAAVVVPGPPDARPPGVPLLPDAGPAPRRPRRIPDAGGSPVPVAILPAIPDAGRPAPAIGTVEVRIRPWCNIEIDGVPHGRSPGPRISLPSGKHHLVCSQPGVGPGIERDLDLAPGEALVIKDDLYGDVEVRVGITSGEVLIDGQRATGMVRLRPGTHYVGIGGGGPKSVHIPTRPCTLRETPELACYE